MKVLSFSDSLIDNKIAACIGDILDVNSKDIALIDKDAARQIIEHLAKVFDLNNADEPSRIFDEGVAARRLNLVDNPYLAYSGQWHFWWSGWLNENRSINIGSDTHDPGNDARQPLTILDRYKIMNSAANSFYKNNSKEIEQQRNSEAADEIKDLLPKILTNHSVWCRNANICMDAELCKHLECEYKNSKEDVVAGCAKCHSFQITNISNTWAQSVLTHRPSSCKLSEGN